MALTDLEVREAFHCLLLAHIPESFKAPGGGPAPLRLKGGVNLRLFSESPRYSEDIDFDLVPARGDSFQDHLRRVLDSTSFKRDLLQLQITDVRLSEIDGGASGFKQKLRLEHGGVFYPTKVEVSYREETKAEEAEFLTIPARFQGKYGLVRPFSVAAYPRPVAMWQKALALSRRAAPQTRDAYDLHHLMRIDGGGSVEAAEKLVRERMTAEQIEAAAEVVSGFTAEMFRYQTAAFLPESIRQQGVDQWAETQKEAWAWLESMRPTPEPEKQAGVEQR